MSAGSRSAAIRAWTSCAASSSPAGSSTSTDAGPAVMRSRSRCGRKTRRMPWRRPRSPAALESRPRQARRDWLPLPPANGMSAQLSASNFRTSSTPVRPGVVTLSTTLMATSESLVDSSSARGSAAGSAKAPIRDSGNYGPTRERRPARCGRCRREASREPRSPRPGGTSRRMAHQGDRGLFRTSPRCLDRDRGALGPDWMRADRSPT